MRVARSRLRQLWDRHAAWIALGYFVIGTTWIITSDSAVEMVAGGNPERVRVLQSYKGVTYVGITTVALYAAGALLNARRRHDEAERRKLEEMLHVAQRLEAFGTLAGSVVHDFANLILVLRGSVELMVLDENDPAARERHRLKMEETIDRATQLTRQLVLFMRSESSAFEAGDLGALLERCAPVLRQALGSRGELKLGGTTGLPPVRFVRSQLEGSLLNLVINARDAFARGRPGIVSVRAATLNLRHYRCPFRPERVSGDFVVIRVEDNGCGIAPEHLERLFSPFFTTKPAGQGTGLGLTSTLRVMQTHGGWIEVTSALDRGTCFSLYFPVAGAVALPIAA